MRQSVEMAINCWTVDYSPNQKFLRRNLIASSERLLAFLNLNRVENIFKFPYSHSFPRNACESVSMIFALLVEERFGVQAAIIRGTDTKKYEHHFWVLAGGRIYDLTAQQFRGRQPILGAAVTPLARRFAEQQETHELGFVDRSQVIDLFHRGIIPF